MATLGLHPRLAHMVLRARELGHGAVGCVVAALLEERDIMRTNSTTRDADLRHRVSLIVDASADAAAIDRDVVRRVRDLGRRLRSTLGIRSDELVDPEDAGWVLALAYPDRVAQRRGGAGHRYLLRNGLGAVLPEGGSLTGAPFLTIAEIDGRVPESRIFLAAPLERADVDRLFADQLSVDDVVEWDPGVGTVVAVRREQLGAIVLRESPIRTASDEPIARALLSALRRADDLTLTWTDHAHQLRQRLAFMHELDPSWPDVSDAALAGSMEHWLLPHLIGLRRRTDVQALDPGAMLLEMLDWRQRHALDELAPTHLVVPTGSRIRVDYGDPRAPALPVRLQELFGLAQTPRIGGGTVPITLHLLSPARRPVQVTQDLAGFWRSSYFDVRKELRGRYPKHAWPEDPLTAPATRYVKHRGDR
jgi:ATP-dependent helicase HrpB